MKKLLKTLPALFLMGTLSAAFVNAQQKQDLYPFPAAADGMVRHVIDLPEEPDESTLKVEIIPGKTMLVDCNIHILSGDLTEKDLQGWGYSYYEFTSDGQTASTMMACHEPEESKFVSGKTLLVRYNSKLPVVVYAPQGYDIKYRIWEAGKEQLPIVK